MAEVYFLTAAVVLAAICLFRLPARLRLSRAKYPGLAGHFRLARRVARLVPAYEFTGQSFFACDDAPEEIVVRRREAFERLAGALAARAPKTLAAAENLDASLPDVAFVNAYRVPFQFRREVRRALKIGGLADRTEGTRVRDLDGNWSFDLGGSYGVNVFGYDFYKSCIDAAVAEARDLGPVLGPYHPAMLETVDRLRDISGLDEVSFHMSGTEAVMQAVRLARFHTKRTHLVMFCGAYHGWWDGVQPNVASERTLDDVYMLTEMSETTLSVIRERKDIACVLVNPIQAMHPNTAAPGDGMLVDSSRRAWVDKEAYARWLSNLREACNANGVALIFDEVFVGFRLARGGAQEYFGVRADLVTYGKTLAGGLPVGVVCGRHALMQRFREDEPTRICFARGTFNSHPYVVCAMREFLRRLDEPEIRSQYDCIDEVWNARARALNAALEDAAVPMRFVNLTSVWTLVYLLPGRYNWMLQFYLRSEGLQLGWIGTGRLIFAHNFSDEDFAAVSSAIVRAARRMKADGWWWHVPGVTNKTIRRRVLREMLQARFGQMRPRLAGRAGEEENYGLGQG